MTHLEAQSYIMPFIEHKVPHDKQEDFVLHMKSCKKCHEELEIYYTLLVGMRQLDNKEELSTDFSKDLDRELKSLSHGVRNRKSFKVSAFSIVLSSILIIGLFFYAGFLNKIYSFEQFIKSAEQGDYYFKDSFEGVMLLEDKDEVEESQKIIESKNVSNYQRILGYKKLVNDYDRLMEIGEELNNVEITTDWWK